MRLFFKTSDERKTGCSHRDKGGDCSVDGGEEGAASSLRHSKHGEDGRGKKTGTKMAREEKRREDVLLSTCSTEHGASSPEATNQNRGL